MRKKPVRLPDRESGMTADACDIAVSEMLGVPLGQICGYALIVTTHRTAGESHELMVMQRREDWRWAAKWLELAAADVRSAHG